jgi:hypothetical protein
MERIKEFTREKRDFIYFDLSGFKSNDEFTQTIEKSKPLIKKYAEMSLYTITNIEGVRYDTTTKKIVAQWMEHNKPYVKYGVVIGMDSIKRMMVNAIFTLSGRKNMSSASTLEKAVEWLLKQK